MRLSGQETKQLLQALQSAFSIEVELKQMVRTVLDENLDSIAGGSSLSATVFNLIEWARAHGRLEELVKGAYFENPKNPELQQFAQQFLNLSDNSKSQPGQNAATSIRPDSTQGRSVSQTAPLPPAEGATSKKTLTWLHLSDLHICKIRTGWDSARVLKTLLRDLKQMEKEYGLHPDLFFFTGDVAFGQIGSKPGETISDQFKEAHTFFEGIRTAFTPHIPKENVFLVPGNHDVNREEILSSQTSWLDQQRNLDDIIRMCQTNNREWRSCMERLADYRRFLSENGYDHLLTDPNRLIYAHQHTVEGVRVGIYGLNSAWSCGREGERGKLWVAGKWQIGHLKSQIDEADLHIALIHHPDGARVRLSPAWA